MKPLTPAQLEAARDALVAGYYNWSLLDELAAFALDIQLEAEVGKGGPLKSIAYELLKLTESEGWTEMLLRDALARKPGNDKLHHLATSLGLAPAPFSGAAAAAAGGYEALIAKISPLQSTGTWRKRMVDCERKVCQILAGGEAIGTGFLVGPQLVMSNWHVFERAGGGALAPLAAYATRFDFRSAEGEKPADDGIVVPIDAQAGYLGQSHKAKLDYVLVSLAEKAGGHAVPGGGTRGWLALSERTFEPNETCLVLQHPGKRTLEVAPGAVTGWMPQREGDIYEHLADTERGSSGSPCFAPDWTLLALHHRVDPVTGLRNRAIAIPAILAHLRSEGKLGLLPPKD